MKFPEQPDITPLPNGFYCLRSNYIYDDGQNYIFIKEGFIHDGASVPRFAWTISGVTPDGMMRAAALVHDFVYRSRRDYTKAAADDLFHTILLRSGFPPRKAKAAYWAVKLFGRSSFKAARASER